MQGLVVAIVSIPLPFHRSPAIFFLCISFCSLYFSFSPSLSLHPCHHFLHISIYDHFPGNISISIYHHVHFSILFSPFYQFFFACFSFSNCHTTTHHYVWVLDRLISPFSFFFTCSWKRSLLPISYVLSACDAHCIYLLFLKKISFLSYSSV